MNPWGWFLCLGKTAAAVGAGAVGQRNRPFLQGGDLPIRQTSKRAWVEEDLRARRSTRDYQPARADADATYQTPRPVGAAFGRPQTSAAFKPTQADATYQTPHPVGGGYQPPADERRVQTDPRRSLRLTRPRPGQRHGYTPAIPGGISTSTPCRGRRPRRPADKHRVQTDPRRTLHLPRRRSQQRHGHTGRRRPQGGGIPAPPRGEHGRPRKEKNGPSELCAARFGQWDGNGQ